MSPEAAIIDGTVEEEIVAARPGTGLERRRSEVIQPLPADQVREAFAACQAAVLAVLGPDDFEGKGDDRFLKKSGMRKVAAVTDLDVSIVSCVAERDVDGRVVSAAAIARATSAAGRAMDGDGYCSLDESRFKTDKGRARLEHDLRSTATTRAKTRAIAELLGIDVAGLQPPSGSAGAVSAPASEELRNVAFNAIMWLVDGDVETSDTVIDKLELQFGDPLPGAPLQAVLITCKAIKDHRERTAAAAAKEAARG